MMMVSSPCTGDPSAAAAALDRTLRSGNRGGGGDAPAAATMPPDASPDVVVTLGQGGAPPSTYNAAGRMAGAPTLEDLGANRPASMAHATESTDARVDTSSAAAADASTADTSTQADSVAA